MPIQKKTQQVTTDNSSDIVLDKFMKVAKNDTKEPYLFLFNDTSLLSDNSLRFGENSIKKKFTLNTKSSYKN